MDVEIWFLLHEKTFETKNMAQHQSNSAPPSPDNIPSEMFRELLLRAHEHGYGFVDEWRSFAERNEAFIKSFPDLMQFSWQVFRPSRRYTLRHCNEVIAFSLLGLAQEDFQQILCLAVNAYGSAAQARVRTMFERVVLAAYFLKFPDKVESYIHFELVERRKRLVRARELYSARKYRALQSTLEQRLVELDTQIQALKARFGKSFTRKWTEKGFDALSADVGLQGHYLYCYLVPNAFVHASPSDLVGRIVEEDRVYVELGRNPRDSDEALKSAHVLLVFSFGIADQLLKLRRKTAILKLTQTCVRIYKSKPSRLAL
jgi:uncharacterized protein DUF5677